ncbi:MAG: hypothetical protein ACRDON_00500 [Gaiellaceae bacterium]
MRPALPGGELKSHAKQPHRPVELEPDEAANAASAIARCLRGRCSKGKACV